MEFVVLVVEFLLVLTFVVLRSVGVLAIVV